jgi:hypothetical protein
VHINKSFEINLEGGLLLGCPSTYDRNVEARPWTKPCTACGSWYSQKNWWHTKLAITAPDSWILS